MLGMIGAVCTVYEAPLLPEYRMTGSGVPNVETATVPAFWMSPGCSSGVDPAPVA